ncbi:MAG: tetratricopeptide repeat protein [Planctomycetes bacterium]|nr:tetratricopeptide repeat protein [Planctomycetota bacterium]
MNGESRKYQVFWICVVLVLVTTAVYWQVHEHEFLDYDDNVYVTSNPNVNGGLTKQSVIWAFTTYHISNWHPLTWLSHMTDCELYGLNPSGHYLTNLLLHIVNTLLLFLILRHMTGAIWPSAFVAAAFALHPLHVESVAWIAERKGLLGMFFWLLIMWAYVRYAQCPDIRKFSLVFLFLALGLMAKPILVTLPFVLLLLDYWPLQRTQWNNRGEIIRLIVEKIPLFVLTAVSAIVTFIGEAVTPGELFPLSSRISNAVVSYLSYIGKMFWPVRLAVFYPHRIGTLSTWQVVAAALLLIIITVLVIRSSRTRKYLLVGWLWYVVTLLPVIGFIQVGLQSMADRYTYLPLVGLFIMIAWGAAELCSDKLYRKVTVKILTGAAIIAMVICTRVQLSYWQNGETLFKHSLDVTENNHVMHNSLGVMFASRGRFSEAINQFHLSLSITPGYASTHYNLACTFQLQGKIDEAITQYKAVLQIIPGDVEVYVRIGEALQSQGKFNEAINYYRRAVELAPKDGQIRRKLDAALTQRDKLSE